MRRRNVLAMIAVLSVAVLAAAQIAMAGNGAPPTIPEECQAAVDSGRFEVIFAEPGEPTDGGSGSQVIIGTSGDDVIDGGSGSDVICGGGGNDTIDGGSGSDRIFGNEGNDTLLGGTGSDFIDGGPGSDICDGGTGSNTLVSCNDIDPEPSPPPMATPVI